MISGLLDSDLKREIDDLARDRRRLEDTMDYCFSILQQPAELTRGSRLTIQKLLLALSGRRRPLYAPDLTAPPPPEEA
jgi:hypothetical protein